MRMKTSLILGASAIVALLVAGVSYWAIREKAQSGPPPTSTAEAPAGPVQTPSAPQISPPVNQENNRAASSPAPASPPPEASAPTPNAPATPATSAQPSQATALPPSAAMALAVPDEEKMSETNRRQVQEALHRSDFYDGPIDGIFGPLTRAAIRRFQDSIGEKETGRLTAAEAGRLVSVTGLGTDTGAHGTGGLGISETPVGHRQPKPSDLPPSVLQEEQGSAPTPDNPTAAQNNARARGGSKRDSGSTGNTGAYGQIPSICTGC
jgi:peptidoglycan hydrolase-like protein with peptidoglycan-binding domain